MNESALQEIDDSRCRARAGGTEGKRTDPRFGRAAAGDRQAAEELVLENRGLVGMILRRFQVRECDRQELEQAGDIGLFKAIRGFDSHSGYAFSTYAVPFIIGEIRRQQRSAGLLHVSRPIQENALRLRRAREEWNREKGGEPTLEELGSVTGLSGEELILAMESSGTVDSLDRPMSEEGRSDSLGETLADDRDPQGSLVESLALRQAVGQLEEGDRRLIRLRYLDEKTQQQTARLLGTSQAAVSRSEKRILAQLRRKLR